MRRGPPSRSASARRAGRGGRMPIGVFANGGEARGGDASRAHSRGAAATLAGARGGDASRAGSRGGEAMLARSCVGGRVGERKRAFARGGEPKRAPAAGARAASRSPSKLRLAAGSFGVGAGVGAVASATSKPSLRKTPMKSSKGDAMGRRAATSDATAPLARETASGGGAVAKRLKGSAGIALENTWECTDNFRAKRVAVLGFPASDANRCVRKTSPLRTRDARRCMLTV